MLIQATDAHTHAQAHTYTQAHAYKHWQSSSQPQARLGLPSSVRFERRCLKVSRERERASNRVAKARMCDKVRCLQSSRRQQQQQQHQQAVCVLLLQEERAQRTATERVRAERNSESERSERTSSQAPNVVRVVVSDAVSAVVVAVLGRRR